MRAELRLSRAVADENYALAAELRASAPRRSSLLAALRLAVADESYGEAAQLAAQLRLETERRMDTTLDEGSYDSYLDQDDWYAAQLARERERELANERRRAEERTGSGGRKEKGG